MSYTIAPNASSPGVVTINEPLYNDATQSTGAVGALPVDTTVTNYNALGQVVSTVDEYGNTTQNIYDANGNLVETINPNGTETRTAYDADNRPYLTMNSFVPATSGDSSADGTLTLYNSLGQTVETDTRSGVDIEVSPDATTGIATFAVNSEGTLLGKTTTAYNSDGTVASTTSPSGQVTTYTYNPDGTKATETAVAVPVWNSTTLQNVATNLTTAYQYDADGRQTKVSDPAGHITKYAYDTLGNLTTTTYNDNTTTTDTYNSAGQKISQTDQNGNQTTYTYDNAGNLIQVDQPAVLYNGVSTHPITEYVYDKYGDEIAEISPDAYAAYQAWLAETPSQQAVNPFTDETSYTYDANGQKLSEALPDGELQTWSYDASGNQIVHKVYSATNHTTALQTMWNIYDTSNDGHGGQIEAEYRYTGDFTPAGSTITYADSTNYQEKTLYTYDNLGRQSSVIDYTNSGGTATVSTYTDYTYDPITANEASITTPDGTINDTYNDATGQLVETTTNANDTYYYYDPAGQLADVYSLELNGTRYATFTALNSSGLPTFSGTPLTISYSYDASGNLASVADPNGMTTTYTYDDLKRLTDELVTDTTTNEPIFQAQYTVGNNGQRKTETDARYNVNGSVSSQIEYSWMYDADDRLSSEQLQVLSGGGSGVPTAYTDSFTYDLNSNRLSETITGGTTGNGTNNYAYNNDDQLTTETGTYTATSNNYSTSYYYDADGNLYTETRTGSGATNNVYYYDLRKRMTSSTTNGITTTYTYDTSGVLASQTAGGSTTYYLNDPNNPTGYTKAIQTSTTLGGAPTTSYVLGNDIVAQGNSTNGVLYLLTDGHGSTRALVNSNGVVATGQTFDYDAFGDALDFTPATAETTWLFGGDGFYDPSTGWTYQLARWRNGFWFTQMDSFGGDDSDPMSLHKYVYAGVNPIYNIDPSGHDFFSLAELLLDTAVDATLDLIDAGVSLWTRYKAIQAIDYITPLFGGALEGFTNEIIGPKDVSKLGLFAIGFVAGYVQTFLGTQELPGLGASIGSAIEDTFNTIASTDEKFTVRHCVEILSNAIVAGGFAHAISIYKVDEFVSGLFDDTIFTRLFGETGYGSLTPSLGQATEPIIETYFGHLLSNLTKFFIQSV